MEIQNAVLEKLEQLEKLIVSQVSLQKSILNFHEACQYLSVSRSYLYKLTSGKKIPYFSPQGKKIYFSRLELDNWLKNNERLSLKRKLNKAFMNMWKLFINLLPTLINAIYRAFS